MVKFGWDKLKRFLAQANSWTGTQTFATIAVTTQTTPAASTSATGVVELATDAETAAGTDTTRALTASNLAAMKAFETLWIPAASMTPTATNGGVMGTKEFATNDINGDYIAFDTTTEQYAEFQIPMPEGWDRSTIKAKYFWSPTDDTGDTAKTVEWGMQAGALSNDDAFDAALGTEQVISDTILAGESGDLHVTAATPALTVAGTPALGDLVHFKIYRHVSGTDDYGANALLWGVWIQYKNTNTVAIW